MIDKKIFKTALYISKMDPVERIIYRSILRKNRIGIEALKTEVKQNVQ